MKTETINKHGWMITLTQINPHDWAWEAAKPNGGALKGYRPTRDWALLAANDAIFEDNYMETLAAERRAGA